MVLSREETQELIWFYLNRIQSGLKEYHAFENLKFDVDLPVCWGPGWERRKSRSRRELNVDFPLLTHSKAWDYRKLDEHVLSYPSYVCYLKDRRSYSSSDRDIIQKYGTSDPTQRSLDPSLIKTAFQYEVQSVLENYHCPADENEWRIKNTLDSSLAMTLEINKKSKPNYIISIDIAPALHIAKPREENVFLVQNDSGHWRKSFFMLDKDAMNTITKMVFTYFNGE